MKRAILISALALLMASCNKQTNAEDNYSKIVKEEDVPPISKIVGLDRDRDRHQFMVITCSDIAKTTLGDDYDFTSIYNNQLYVTDEGEYILSGTFFKKDRKGIRFNCRDGIHGLMAVQITR